MSELHIPAWMTAQRLSVELSISVPTVHRWAKLGRIPPGKRVNGGVRLWQWREVERSLGLKPAGGTIDWDARIDNAAI